MAARGGNEELQVKEQQAEALEEKLAQRAVALADSAKSLAGRRAALNTLLQQARGAGVEGPAQARELLGADPLAPSPAVREAREGAEQARRAAAEARLRAAQLWEEELTRQQAALAQLVQRIAEAQAAVQAALEEAEARAAEAAVAEEASPFAPTPAEAAPIPLGSPLPKAPPSPPPSRPVSAPGRAPPPAPRPEPLGHNKRVHHRARLKVQVDFESDHNFFTGFSSDISEGGLFIATVNIQPLGAPVEVAFALPTGEQVMARGLVKWVREPTDENQAQPGMGIQFEALPDDAREAVHRFITQRDPIFYDE